MRVTRSGVQFSPWDEAVTLPADNAFDFQGLLSSSLEREAGLEDFTDDEDCTDDEDAGEEGAVDDVEEVDLFSLSPLSSPDASPVHNAAELPPNPDTLSTPSASLPLSATASKKRRGHANRRRKRGAEKANLAPHDYEVRPSTRRKYVPSEGMETGLRSEDAPIAKTGFIGIRGTRSSATYALKQLVGPNSRLGFELVEWDGRTSVAILDSEGRVVAVLVGQPSDDPSWEQVQQDAAGKLEQVRGRCKFSPKQRSHRRGRFPALATGISHGGGQLKPGNLDHGSNDAALKSLAAHPSFIRMAGFASGAFANWAPRLYNYYSEHLKSLLEHDKSTHRPFENSVWAAATFNFGPNTICFKHRDSANLPFGWCGITALGTFNPKRGGHLVLWDARRVVEFPPGSTILVPSAAIAHSNVPIRRGERRYSFTQYTSGAIFRWVEFGYSAVKKYHASLSKHERDKLVLKLKKQLEMGLGLFSTLEELRDL